jgi:thiamine biosynthesis lipoprotein
MTPSRVIAITLLSVIFLAAIIVLRGCYDNPFMIENESLLMGTIVQIKVPAGANGSSAKIEEAISKAFAEILRVESVFSAYDAASEISKINRLTKGEELKISAEAFYLIDKAMAYSDRTGGAFDITVKPLIDIWAKAKADGKVPSEIEIKSAMEKVGSSAIILDKSRFSIVFAKPGMAIDLGGVAKGYAVDRAIKTLKESGIKSAIVHAGGDMYCLGSRSGDKSWKVGIQHPRNERAITYELEVKNKSVDTSGDYERYFTIGEKRYSHIIDPRTGMPIGDDVVSVTVVADDPAIGDIYSTALSILGEDGLRLAKEKGIDAAMVRKNGDRFNVMMTEGFKERYNVKEKSKL